VKTVFSYADPATHWRQRLNDGLSHNIGLVIAKAVQGQLAAGVPKADVVRQVALFGAHNRDGWGVGLTILTALANLLSALPDDEAYLAISRGRAVWRRTATGSRRAGNERRLKAAPNRPPSSAGYSAGQRFVIARRPSAPCSLRSPRVFRPLRWPTPCSPPRRRGPSLTMGTRSTSSTRRSNAWTRLAGGMLGETE
jgi:hypothetical protein